MQLWLVLLLLLIAVVITLLITRMMISFAEDQSRTNIKMLDDNLGRRSREIDSRLRKLEARKAPDLAPLEMRVVRVEARAVRLAEMVAQLSADVERLQVADKARATRELAKKKRLDEDDDGLLNDEPLVRMREPASHTDFDAVRQVNFLAAPDRRHPGRYYLVVTSQTATRTQAVEGAGASELDVTTFEGFAKLKNAFNEATSRALVNDSGAWSQTTAGWTTTSSMSLGELADAIGGLKAGIHETLTHDPAAALSGYLKLNPMQTSSVEAVLAAYALPFDSGFKNIKLMVQVTGMIFGLLTHNPLMTNACFKSWTHDRVVRTVSNSIGEFFQAEEPEQMPDLERQPSTKARAEAAQQDELWDIYHRYFPTDEKEPEEEEVPEDTELHLDGPESDHEDTDGDGTRRESYGGAIDLSEETPPPEEPRPNREEYGERD